MRLAERDMPAPTGRQVLIEVACVGVNRPEVLQRAGAYPPPPGASPYLGLEVSGTVAAAGPEARQWKVGDAVCALTPGGGYAQYCLADERHCLPVPR
jgi:NADPH:quinone reductase-like Zn-dependent oxidoreductase